uniref:PD-(D/E)XK endonuclease-like domain-containing protein n=1 Tax=Rhodnius prolixus TaxID=13249 RepID=T1HEF5_RHOPR
MQSGNVFTPPAPPQPKTDSTRPKKAEQEKPRLEDQPLPVAVALAALYGNEGRYLDSDKITAAVDVTETLNGKDRNAQIDALTMALKGVPRATQLHGEDVFNLAVQILEHWDALPGITERREYAELLLDMPRDERAGVKPTVTKKETEATVGDTPEDIFKQARNLIMELTTAEQFEADETTSYAEEGTTAHHLAETILRNRLKPQLKASPVPQVSQEMVDKVGEYVEAVWTLAQQPGAILLVEQKCDFSHIVGIPNQFGTSDAVIILGDELQIHDLKYGYEKVDAFENPQLMLYALGALEQVSLIADIHRVRMFIHQPRINHLSEYECSVQNLEEFGQNVKAIAADVLQLADDAGKNGPDVIPASAYHPGEKTCRWCKRRGKCQVQAEYVAAALINDFSEIADPPPLEDALTTARQKLAESDGKWLGETLPLIDHIESWCKSVRSAAFNLLQNGHSVSGYKLVQGKQGNRIWGDEREAEALLKSFRLKGNQIYTHKLIGPKQAENLLKKDNPRRWAQVEAIITRPDGKPAMVPEADPKPALIINPVNDFDDVEAAESLI